MTSALLGLRFVLAFLAVYHLAIGLLSAFAPAWTRKVSRGLYALELSERFQVPRGRNAFNTGLLVVQVALLVYWFPR